MLSTQRMQVGADRAGDLHQGAGRCEADSAAEGGGAAREARRHCGRPGAVGRHPHRVPKAARRPGWTSCMLRTLSLPCITPASASHPETTFLHHSSIVPTVLTPQGAASVSAYVTHGVFPNATYERFSPQGDGSSADGFKYFWITDSCANTAHALRDRPPFEVIACSSALQSHHYAVTLCSAAWSTET